MLKNTLQSKKNTFKFFLLGSNGLLGSKLKEILPKNQTLTFAKKNADLQFNLSKMKKLEKVFSIYKFDYVINCIGFTDVNKCEKNSHECFKINSQLVNLLSRLSLSHKFKLVHISTDHLYKGRPDKLNREVDNVLGINKYAKSKLLAEAYASKNKNNLIIRTNFTGFRKKIERTFVGQLYLSALKQKKIRLYTNIFTSTLDVVTCAGLIKKLIMKNAKGIYNCGTSFSISKSDFALFFAKSIGKELIYDLCLADTKSTNRPKFLGLDVSKIEKKLKIKMISPYKAIKNLTKNLPKIK